MHLPVMSSELFAFMFKILQLYPYIHKYNSQPVGALALLGLLLLVEFTSAYAAQVYSLCVPL